MTSRRLASAGLFALTLGAVGCAVLPDSLGNTCGIKASTTGDDDAGCGFVPTGDAASDGGAVAWDGGGDQVGSAPLARKSLCGDGCNPDNALACVADGGDAATESCRVVLGAGQQTSSECVKSGQGLDGASCTSGADCAPGFECVGTGQCRHYCCDDTACSALTNTTYNTYYCDLASEHASPGAVVPACEVVKDCQLFGMDQCGAGQACTIVEIEGGKSFVATCADVGEGALGDSCETQHCGSGLACIGAIGQRTCQQLCNGQHPCPANSSEPYCNTKSPALAQFDGVGVCGP